MGRDTFHRNTFLSISGLVLAVTFLIACAVHAVDLERAQWHAEEYQKAQAASAQALSQQNQAEYHTQQALAQEHLANARRLYEEAGVQNDPASESFFRYIAVLRDTGDYDIGIEVMESAIKLGKENAENLFILADFAYMAGPTFYEKSFVALKKAQVLQPNNPAVYLRLGQIYRHQGVYETARRNFESALNYDARLAEATIELAILDVREGKVVQASNALDELGIAAQPFDVQTRLLLREALADLDRSGINFEDTHDYHQSYARLLYRAARLPDALLAAYRVVKLTPEDGSTWRFIGDMQQQSGNLNAAIQSYEEAAKYLPENPELVKLIQQLKKLQG